MSTISLNLKPIKNLKVKEFPLAQGLTVAIGSNGSGKSTLLESIFALSIEKLNDTLTVCFTSGPNENFTSIYDKYRKQNRGKLDTLKTLNLNKYLFDISWAPFLIVLAAFRNSEEKPSLVYQFLKDRNYKIEDLAGHASIKSGLIAKINEDSELVTSKFIAVLEKLTGVEVLDYKRSRNLQISLKSIVQKKLASPNEVLSDEVYSSLLELVEILQSQIPDNVGGGAGRVNLIRKLIVALSLGNLNESMYPLGETSLAITREGGNFSNRELSDGEYQLLMTYSILDLFDEKDSILLFDEMDSHVHQKLIPFLWSRVSRGESYILTTTHNPTSLRYCDCTKIIALRAGQIVSGREYVSELSNIFDNKETTSRVLALGFRNVSNLLLIDDYQDWFVFTELAKRKLGDSFDKRLESDIQLHKVTSDQNIKVTSQNAKYKFINDVISYFKRELTDQEQRQKKLKSAVVIFDRDLRDLQKRYQKSDGTFQIVKEDGPNLDSAGPYRINASGVTWHLREIENYLICPTLLSKVSDTEIIGNLSSTNHILTKTQVLDAINKSEIETIAAIDCKKFIQRFTCHQDESVGKLGFSEQKTIDLIGEFKPEEISDYVKTMHDYLVSTLFG